MEAWKHTSLYEVPVSRKRPHKEVRLQVTLEGGYSSRVSDKRWKRVPDTCPCNKKKARSPIVILRVGGTTIADVDAERSRLPESLVIRRSSSTRYAGAVPCRQQKTSTESLNSIRSCTRSQWRSRSSGVTCSYFRAERTNRAAAFMNHDWLQSVDLIAGQTVQRGVAVVQSWQHQRNDQWLQNCWWHRSSNAAQLA